MDRDSMLAVAGAVSPLTARLYLKARGWTETSAGGRDDVYLFKHKKYKFAQIVVPKSTNYDCYPEDILTAVHRLAEIEQRPEDAVLTQLNNPDSDTLRYRVISPRANLGTVSLRAAQQLIKSISESLAASICDCRSQTLFHPNLGQRDAKRLLDKAQFGQTERGSYVVKVIAPLDELNDGSNVFSEMRDGKIRQCIVHLMNSASRLVEVVKKGNVESFIRRSQSKPTFSCNLVRSLVKMQVWDDSAVELSAEWAPTLRPDKRVSSRVLIENDFFPQIARIGEAFLPKEREDRTELFSGVVSELCGDVDENDMRYGEVIVQVLTTTGDSFPAKLDLTQKQYRQADESHMKNKQLIFSGKLVRKIRSMDEIRDISFLKLCDE